MMHVTFSFYSQDLQLIFRFITYIMVIDEFNMEIFTWIFEYLQEIFSFHHIQQQIFNDSFQCSQNSCKMYAFPPELLVKVTEYKLMIYFKILAKKTEQKCKIF